jgi:hypothetical protein
MKTVELSEDQIQLLIRILRDQSERLAVIITEPNTLLEPTTIRDCQIEHREINNIVRELQYFVVTEEQTKANSDMFTELQEDKSKLG